MEISLISIIPLWITVEFRLSGVFLELKQSRVINFLKLFRFVASFFPYFLPSLRTPEFINTDACPIYFYSRIYRMIKTFSWQRKNSAFLRDRPSKFCGAESFSINLVLRFLSGALLWIPSSGTPRIPADAFTIKLVAASSERIDFLDAPSRKIKAERTSALVF